MEAKIIKWFVEKGIKKGDPSTIVEEFQATQKSILHKSNNLSLGVSMREPRCITNSQLLSRRKISPLKSTHLEK